MSNKLNKRHKQFADEYLANGLNGTQAYFAVYKSVKKEETAKVNASKLLTNTNVKAYIDSELKKTSDKLEIKREDLIKDTLAIADCYDELKRLAMKEELTPNEEAKYNRLKDIIKASDANKAREMIIKANGWNEPDKQEITIKSEQPLFSKDNPDGKDN